MDMTLVFLLCEGAIFLSEAFPGSVFLAPIHLLQCWVIRFFVIRLLCTDPYSRSFCVDL